jgi:hypothetical protein
VDPTTISHLENPLVVISLLVMMFMQVIRFMRESQDRKNPPDYSYIADAIKQFGDSAASSAKDASRAAESTAAHVEKHEKWEESVFQNNLRLLESIQSTQNSIVIALNKQTNILETMMVK